MSKNNRGLKNAAVWLMAIVLIFGVVAGAGIWLLNVEVPIEYDQPYVISMSQNETGDYNWRELPVRDTTTTDTADFGATLPSVSYNQYVKIENPEGGADVNVTAEINEPSDFSDDMGFTILSGIVEPTEVPNGTGVDSWGSITHSVLVPKGETLNFTVIYTLSKNVTASSDQVVTWGFSESLIKGNTVINLDTDKEYNTIQGALSEVNDGETLLMGPGTYSVSGTLSIPKDNITLRGTGPDHVIILRDGTENGIKVPGRYGVTFEGFTLKNAGHYGFKLQTYSSNLLIEDVRVVGSARTGIDFNRVTNSTLRDVEVEENGVSTGLNGISLVNASGISIIDSRTNGNGNSGMAMYGNVTNVTIQGCSINNENLGMYFEYDVIPTIYDNITIEDNEFTGMSTQNLTYNGTDYEGYIYLIEPGFQVDFEYVLNHNTFDHDAMIFGEEGVDSGQAVVHLIE